jgi:hypothetical protein
MTSSEVRVGVSEVRPARWPGEEPTRSSDYDRIVTSEAYDQQARWDAWRAKGARAVARTQRQATWLALALFGMALLWVAIELMRSPGLAR